MSRWIEHFKTNPFFGDLSRLQESLGESTFSEKEASLEAVQEHARLRKAIEYIRVTIEGIDPELMPSSYLPTFNTHLQNVVGELNSFNLNGNIGHLRNANSHVDQMLSLATQVPLAAFGVVRADLSRAATQYAETLDRHAVAYVSRIDDLVENSKNKMIDFEEGMENARNGLSKIDLRIANVETSVQSQLSSFNSAFQASESSRSNAFELWLTGFKEAAISDYKKLVEQNAAGLTAMLSYQDDAARVLGTVIDTAQAGAYAKYANEERVIANWYRRFAIGSMLAAALILFVPELIHLVEKGANYAMDWKMALYRLPFSLVLFAPSLYLAKESSRHRLNEVHNRRRQHILTTIGPYLALLPQEKADEIKAEVARNVFSENLPVFDDKTPDAGTLAAFSQLMAMLAKK